MCYRLGNRILSWQQHQLVCSTNTECGRTAKSQQQRFSWPKMLKRWTSRGQHWFRWKVLSTDSGWATKQVTPGPFSLQCAQRVSTTEYCSVTTDLYIVWEMNIQCFLASFTVCRSQEHSSSEDILSKVDKVCFLFVFIISVLNYCFDYVRRHPFLRVCKL